MFLNYLALAMILMVLVALFYVFVYIHDLPYDIAKHRNHPQQEAIHVACWLSLFTLHAIWPIVYIWAISKQGPVTVNLAGNDAHDRMTQLENRIRELETQASKKSNKPSAS
jgi:archaellum biogenesis protein FlaJ (TadC family)